MSTKARLTRLTEAISEYDRIDRDAGVIFGVKILSSKSRNGRRYLQEAMERARPKYESSKVYLDHVDPKASKRRKTDERWGQLQNVRCQEGALVGDLHYLKSHSNTEQILEAVERFKDAGLSHDAGGKTRTEGGEEVVYDIAEVYSVDFVQNPATNTNLFEERQQMKRKLFATLREHVKVKLASTLLANLTEMGDMYSESTPMLDGEMGAEVESDPDQDIADALKTAVMAVLDSEDDTATKITKIKLILGVKDKIEGTGAAPAASTEPEGETMTEEVKKLQQELTELREQRKLEQDTAACKSLLESLNVEATAVRVNALVPLDADGRKLLAAEFPKIVAKPAKSPGRMQEQVTDELPKDVAGIKNLLGVGSR